MALGLVLGVLAVMAAVPSPSWATWQAGASGLGRIHANALPQGDVTTAVASGRDVTVTWDEAELASGDPVQGYLLARYPESSATAVAMTSCTGVVTGLSCIEEGVEPGLWRYTVTPVHHGWAGTEGPFGGAITVGGPALTITSPTTLQGSSLPATMTATASQFLADEALTFHLDSPTGPVLAGTPALTEPDGTASVAVTIPAGTSDVAHSLFVVGDAGSVASAAFAVVDPPALVTLDMLDTNVNGKIDQVVAAFSEPLASPYTAGSSGWTLGNVPSGGTLASVSVAGSVATLLLDEGAGAATTATGAFTVALAPTSGGIRDANGHRSSFTATAPVDKAAPALTAMPAMQDNTNNGKVDRIVLRWSEPIAAYSAGVSPWALTNAPSAGTLASVTAATGGTATTLTINEGAGAADTAVGAFTMAMVPSAAGIRDAVGNQSSLAAMAPADAARPVRLSQRGHDANGNGRFDRVDVVFSEALGAYTPSTAPWTMTRQPAGSSLASVSLAGATATLGLIEGSSFTTAVGSWRIALAASPVGVADPSGNQASYTAAAITDVAAPAPVSLTIQDRTGGDGVVDRVAILFSESLAAYSAGVAPWTLANTPSGTTLSAAARSSATMNLTLANPTGPGDTTVGSFTVALGASATGVRDSAGNQSAFAARAPVDGAGTAVVNLSTTSGATAGRIAPGDSLSVHLSEPLGAGVVLTSTTTVTLTDPNNTSSDTLTVPGLFNGARSTGSNSYVTLDNSSAAFAGSELSISADRRTVTVTVGPTCAGTACAALGTAASATNVSVLLDPALRDAAGVVPTTVARNIGFRLF